MKRLTQSPLIFTLQSILLLLSSKAFIRKTNGFVLPTPTRSSLQTALFAAAPNPKSMKQKRKKRAPKPFSIPKPNVNVPRPDSWNKIQSTEEQIQLLKEREEERNKAQQEADTRAKQLIETQRKSVAVLTHIKERISSIDSQALIQALNKDECYVVDGFLKKHPLKDSQSESTSSPTLTEDMMHSDTDSITEELISDVPFEILEEGKHMYDQSLMELDVNRGITSGEYTVPITGGEQYIHCPRSVEFVVAMTRNLKQCFDDSTEFQYELDNTKTIASYRFYNRQARMKALQLLTNQRDIDFNDNEKMDELQQMINDTSDLPVFEMSTTVKSDDSVSGNDLRKITLVYFSTSSSWNSCHGGGISYINSSGANLETLDAVTDRLVIFNSVTFKHKFNAWIGDCNENIGGMIVAHLVGVPKGL
jgi:hypothetical protein